jgi:1-acyl-sn-glycerol-3-phosphate acyltransferase
LTPEAALAAPGKLPGIRPLGGRGALRLVRAFSATGRAIAALAMRFPQGATVSAWSRQVLSSLRIKVRVNGVIPGPAPLWAANHLSWLDPLVLLSLRPMGVLAKRDVADYPILGPAATRAGLSFVEREDPLSRAAALVGLVGELRQGRDFLIFPEGTTTRGQHLARVHTGGLLAAHRLGLPALPIRLDCAAPHYPWIGEDTLLPHLRELAAGPPITVELSPGPMLDPASLPDPYEWLAVLRGHLAPRQAPVWESSI